MEMLGMIGWMVKLSTTHCLCWPHANQVPSLHWISAPVLVQWHLLVLSKTRKPNNQGIIAALHISVLVLPQCYTRVPTRHAWQSSQYRCTASRSSETRTPIERYHCIRKPSPSRAHCMRGGGGGEAGDGGGWRGKRTTYFFIDFTRNKSKILPFESGSILLGVSTPTLIARSKQDAVGRGMQHVASSLWYKKISSTIIYNMSPQKKCTFFFRVSCRYYTHLQGAPHTHSLF